MFQKELWDFVFWDLLFLICRFHIVNGVIKASANKILLLSKDFAPHQYIRARAGIKELLGGQKTQAGSHIIRSRPSYNSPSTIERKPERTDQVGDRTEVKEPTRSGNRYRHSFTRFHSHHPATFIRDNQEESNETIVWQCLVKDVNIILYYILYYIINYKPWNKISYIFIPVQCDLYPRI